MNRFVVADTHFDHVNIARHTMRPCVRDGDLNSDGKWTSGDIAIKRMQEMNEFLAEKWNMCVKPKDLVYIVGDFAWKNHGHWINVLNGKKILIKGNHDKMSHNLYLQFTEVHSLLERTIEDQQVVFCHYPLKSWKGSMRGSWHLYGHTHGLTPEYDDSLSFDVGVDIWDYRPIPWDTIIAKMKSRKERIFNQDFEPEKIRAHLRQANMIFLKK